MSTDPRTLGGSIAGSGGPLDVGEVVIDTRNAVILDGFEICLVDPVRAGVRDEKAVLAMTLRGRINKTTDRAEVLFLFDEDGAAGIVTEIAALAVRMGPEYAARLRDRWTPFMAALGIHGPEDLPKMCKQDATERCSSPDYCEVHGCQL